MSQIITYLGIIDNKNNPVVLHNFEETKRDELNFQVNTYCALDIMEQKIYKNKQDSKQQQQQSSSCYVGLLNSIYLADEEYDIYGYQTCLGVKMVLILKQKSNMNKHEDQIINLLFQEIYKLYQGDMFNPFNSNDISTPFKPTQSFYNNLKNKVLKLQNEFQNK